MSPEGKFEENQRGLEENIQDQLPTLKNPTIGFEDYFEEKGILESDKEVQDKAELEATRQRLELTADPVKKEVPIPDYYEKKRKLEELDEELKELRESLLARRKNAPKFFGKRAFEEDMKRGNDVIQDVYDEIYALEESLKEDEDGKIYVENRRKLEELGNEIREIQSVIGQRPRFFGKKAYEERLKRGQNSIDQIDDEMFEIEKTF